MAAVHKYMQLRKGEQLDVIKYGRTSTMAILSRVTFEITWLTIKQNGLECRSLDNMYINSWPQILGNTDNRHQTMIPKHLPEKAAQ